MQCSASNIDELYRKNKQLLLQTAQLLKKIDHKTLDKLIHQLHEQYISEIDCVGCARCCQTLGPRITDIDLQRIAKHLKQKPSIIFDKYLRYDEDGDMVFKQMPCPFLDNENYCKVYAVRPRACAEYPHTDRVKFFQIINLSLKNCATCPIVLEIFISVWNLLPQKK